MNVRLLHVVPMHCVRIIQEISLVHVKKVSLETLIVAVSVNDQKYFKKPKAVEYN